MPEVLLRRPASTEASPEGPTGQTAGGIPLQINLFSNFQPQHSYFAEIWLNGLPSTQKSILTLSDHYINVFFLIDIPSGTFASSC